MISARDFHLPDFTPELSILSNHTEHPKRTSAVLRTTPFYSPPLYQLTRTLAYYSPFLRSLRQMAQRPWQRCLLHTMALYPWVWLPRQLQGQKHRILVTVADLSDVDKKQPPAFLSRRSSTPTRDELGGSFGGRAPDMQDLLTNGLFPTVSKPNAGS